MTDDLGVKKDVSSFVVPVGATINMDGTAIMQGLATMFIASTVGVDLSLVQYGQIVLLAIVTSIGTAAVHCCSPYRSNYGQQYNLSVLN